MYFIPKRWRFYNKKHSNSKSIVSSYIDLGNEREDRDKHEEYMRMMTSFVRRIQCPVADLCGLKSLMDEIPKGTGIYHYALAMNTCGILLATMIQNMSLYYSISSGARDSEHVSHIFTKNIIKVWCDRTTEPRSGYTRAIDTCNSDLKCTFIVEKGVPVSIVGDSLFIRTVLYNLLDNAIKFTPGGSVTANVRTVSSEDGNAMIEIMVSDTGVGIPIDCFEKVFEPLVKSHIESIEGGAGMGLSVCKVICEEMGGGVEVVYSHEKDLDHENSGSTFRALFNVGLVSRDVLVDPINLSVTYKASGKMGSFSSLAPFVTHIASPVPSVHSPSMPVILVVDDVKLIRTMLCNMLTAVSIVPDVACDGYEAVDMCEKKKYDIVIMDMIMPGINGIEATSKIKAEGSNNENTVVISMTASLSNKIKEKGLSSGISTWMTKPVGRDTLYTVLGNNMEPQHIAWINDICQL